MMYDYFSVATTYVNWGSTLTLIIPWYHAVVE